MLNKNEFKNEIEISKLVCEYFIRICKNKKIYKQFKKQFKTLNRESDNPFYEIKSVFEMPNNIIKFTKDNSRDVIENNYDLITNIINHILYFFLDRGRIVNGSKIGAYGQELFDLTCYSLYGDKFLEDMEMIKENSINRLKQDKMLNELYEKYKKHFNCDINIEEFLNSLREKQQF